MCAATAGGLNKSEITPNEKWDGKLHKPIVRKFEKRKVIFPYVDDIWGADFAAMQLISK